MQRGQIIGCITSCVVKKEELGQQPGLRKKDMPSVNDVETCVVVGVMQRKQVGHPASQS